MLPQTINWGELERNHNSLWDGFIKRAFMEPNMTDVRIRNEGNKVFVELPGVGKDNIKVNSVSSDTIKVEWKEKTGKNDAWEHVNLKVMTHNDAKAEYRDGVLILELVDDRVRKTIEIK